MRRVDSRASPPLSPFPEFISLGSAETALYPAPRAKSLRERGEQGKDGWLLLTESHGQEVEVALVAGPVPQGS